MLPKGPALKLCLAVLAVGVVNAFPMGPRISAARQLLAVLCLVGLLEFWGKFSAAVTEARAMVASKRAADAASLCGRPDQGVLEELGQLRKARRAVD